MRLAHLGYAALLLLLLAPLAGREAVADEKPLPKGMEEAEYRKLRGKLRSRSSDWWRRRKKLANKCSQCKGSGKVRWKKGRRWAMVECPKCDGFKLHVDKDLYRYCFYDRRSPAYRLQEGIQERVTKEFVSAQQGNPFPTIVKRYAIKDVQVVDATHGIVYVARNKDSVPRPQKWIWGQDFGKSATWFLYDEGADGPWPGSPAREQPAPKEVPPERPQPPAPAPAPAPAPQPEPKADPTPPDPKSVLHERDELEASRRLVKRWGEERNDVDARLLRIRLGLEDVEGYEEKIASARKFLAEIDGWLVESKPTYERAKKEVVEKGWGIRLDDRIRVNTFHLRAFRRLELIRKLLIVVLPDLKD